MLPTPVKTPPLDLTIRCGFELTYEATAPSPSLLLLKPRPGPTQLVEHESFRFSPRLPVHEMEDRHGNLAHRVVLPAGRTSLYGDALIAVPSVYEDHGLRDEPASMDLLSLELVRYTLPSRYCDSDKLIPFANEQFGHLAHGVAQVRAICDWVHRHIEYRWGAGSPHFSASDVLEQRFGVCRDFAHLALSLCRCFNLPARYVTGFVPDVAFKDPGTPMDFHAYFQVWLGGEWRNFDARFNVPRIGRIDIARGLDAVDAAFSTVYGPARLVWFSVWAYQVDPATARLGDPVDLSTRLDGTPELRFPTEDGQGTHSFST